MAGHAQVFGIEDIGAPFGIGYGEILPRPLFLHKSVFPPAGLGAVPPGCVPAGHIAVSYTHLDVYKRQAAEGGGQGAKGQGDVQQVGLPAQFLGGVGVRVGD